MIRLIQFYTLLLAGTFLTVTPLQAQQPGGKAPMGMGGEMPMMQMPMMQHPVHQTSMMAFMLPALADTLGLSSEQMSRLKELRTSMMKSHKHGMMKAGEKHMQMKELFSGDETPGPDEVRRHFSAMAEMRAGQQAAVYETALEMKQVLTDEQRAMLSEMPHDKKMHLMMMNMSMMDMMQMMQGMNGCMMMGGMMPGNMPGNMMPEMRDNQKMGPGMMREEMPMKSGTSGQ